MIETDISQQPPIDQENREDNARDWYHQGLRERLRRLEMSAVVEFGPNDESLKAMISRLAERAQELLEQSDKLDMKAAVATAVREQIEKIHNRSCMDAICKALDPRAWVGRHRLVEAFESRDVTACYDVALMVHLILEELGSTGSHVVGFPSPTSRLPSFGVLHEGEIFTFQKRDWNSADSFRRLLRSEGMSDRLHNIYPPLALSELVQEWIEKAKGLVKKRS